MAAEPVGVALAIPPLIVMAFKGYISVKNTLRDFQNMDDTIYEVLSHIDTEEKMFKVFVGRLLDSHVDTATKKIMLQNIDGSYWTSPNFSSEIIDGLGDVCE